MVAVIGALVLDKVQQSSSNIPGYTQIPTASTKPGTASPKASATAKPTAANPDSLSLKVPFTPQAPTGNWDQLHNEACEEASAIMAAAYLSGDTRARIPASEVEQQIVNLTKWQQNNFGYYLDTTAAETAQMIRSVYGLRAEVVKDYTEENIKQAVRDNKIAIVVASGRKLGNPYYRQPGPLYHMLVVRGYDGSKIITNDPGTKNGESYSYSFNTLKNAPADWDHSTQTIDESKSVMIVVSK